MKIEKVNENQICCTLTREDLEDRQIKLSELAYGSEKAKGLFRDMIQQANYEFGFEVNDIPLMVEAIPMSSDSIVLLITKVEYPEELDTRFSKFTEFDEDEYLDYYEADDMPDPQGADDILGLFDKIRREKDEELQKGQESLNNDHALGDKAFEQASPEVVKDLAKLFEFKKLDQVKRLSNVLGGYYSGENALYKNAQKNCYVLVLHKSGHTPEEFNKVCNIASEYAKQKNYTPAMRAFFVEHGYTLIEKDALQVLNKL